MWHVSMRQLQVFAEAARTLSFARAAQNLHLTPAAVSLQIKQLEEIAGLALFERIGRRIYLTDAGDALLVHAHSVLHAVRDADETLDRIKGLRGGHITVGMVSTAKYFAPRLLARFKVQYPQVEISLFAHNREEVKGQLARNEIDMAIMGRPPQGMDTIARPFAKHPFVIVADPQHPLAARREISVADLREESFLVREHGSGTRSAMEQLFAHHNFSPRVGMVMSSNETIKQAVMASMGIAFISRHTIGLELATGYLKELDVAGLPVLRDWYVVYRQEKRLSPAQSALRAFILDVGAEQLERKTFKR